MKRLWLRLGVLVYWLAWPALWFYLQRSTRTRLLLVAGDHVLVVRGWMSDGRWQLPGGGLHAGEDPVTGVLREVQEETGLSLEPKLVQQLGSRQFRGNGLRFRCIYFMARLPDSRKVQIRGVEIVDASWFDRASIGPLNCGEDVRQALALLDERT